MKSLYLSSCLLLTGTVLIAQEKQLFTDSFTDNHNDWRLNKKNPKVAFENGYLVDNKTYEYFAALQTIPLKPGMDFRITINIHPEYMDEEYSFSKHVPGPKGHCGIMFGAKDEKNGFCITRTNKGYLNVYKLIDGKEQSLYDKEVKCTNELCAKEISVISENSRWKILNGSGSEIASIAAEPFMGDKIGIVVSYRQKWTIRSFSIFEKDKAESAKKIELPIALFIASFQDLLCSAKDYFRNDFGAAHGQPEDSTWVCNKTVFGMPLRTYLTKRKETLEFSAARHFEDKAEAMNYYDDMKKAIALTPNGCWNMKAANYLINQEAVQSYLQWDNWNNALWGEYVGELRGDVVIATVKATKGPGYDVQLNIVIKWAAY